MGQYISKFYTNVTSTTGDNTQQKRKLTPNDVKSKLFWSNDGLKTKFPSIKSSSSQYGHNTVTYCSGREFHERYPAIRLVLMEHPKFDQMYHEKHLPGDNVMLQHPGRSMGFDGMLLQYCRIYEDMLQYIKTLVTSPYQFGINDTREFLESVHFWYVELPMEDQMGLRTFQSNKKSKHKRPTIITKHVRLIKREKLVIPERLLDIHTYMDNLDLIDDKYKTKDICMRLVGLSQRTSQEKAFEDITKRESLDELPRGMPKPHLRFCNLPLVHDIMRDYELCSVAVQTDCLNLLHVPSSVMTHELCMMAVDEYYNFSRDFPDVLNRKMSAIFTQSVSDATSPYKVRLFLSWKLYYDMFKTIMREDPKSIKYVLDCFKTYKEDDGKWEMKPFHICEMDISEPMFGLNNYTDIHTGPNPYMESIW